MRDLLTYADVGGRRRLRFYVKVTIFILAALIVLAVVAFWQQAQQQQEMAVTRPVVVAPTLTPILTITPAPTATPEPCPTDPEQWTMVDALPNDVNKRIEPACVYDGLARSVAWLLVISEGYSRQTAADALGFDEFPMEKQMAGSPVVVRATNLQGPMPVNVWTVPDVPNFTEWYFKGEGEPAMSVAVRGCFRTYTIAGNERQDWGNGYPVICELSLDNEATNAQICLDGHCYAPDLTTEPPLRDFALYGYAGGGNWVLLGIEEGESIEIDDSQAVKDDRELITGLNGVVPWDGAWLKQAYQLEMQPLPADWQTFTSKADLQAVLDAINAYHSGGANP